MSEQVNNNATEEIDDQITLIMEDGSEILCDVLAIFPASYKNEEHKYIAMLPADTPEDEDAEVFLYRLTDSGDEEIELESIEDDEEFDIVSDAFDELLDEEEFSEMFDENEEDE